MSVSRLPSATVLLLAFVIQGCVTFKTQTAQTIDFATQMNKPMMFSNKAYTMSGGHWVDSVKRAKEISLWNYLGGRPYKNFNNDSSQYQVALEYRDAQHLKITLLQTDSTLFSSLIKGHTKGAYFYLRRRVFILPFVPLLFKYSNDLKRVSFVDDSLILDKSYYEMGGCILFVADHRIAESYYFFKVEN
jgi:hypothetical protein